MDNTIKTGNEVKAAKIDGRRKLLHERVNKCTTIEMRRLVEENFNTIYRVLYDKFKGQNHSSLIGIAYSGLVDAAYAFNPDVGVKFNTFAYGYVYFNIIEMLKQENKLKESCILSGDFTDPTLMRRELREKLNIHGVDYIDLELGGDHIGDYYIGHKKMDASQGKGKAPKTVLEPTIGRKEY